MTLEKLIVIISANTQQLEKAVDRVKSQLSSLETTTSKVSSRLTKAFSKTATGFNRAFKSLGLLGLTAGLISFGKSAIQAGSDLEEWQNVVEVAFGNATSEAERFAKNAIKQFGMSEISAKKVSSTFMAMANGLGIGTEAGAKMSIQLAGLSADMASFFNTTTEATSNALQGIFTGQSRALKQFGIVMNEANLEAYRLSRGIQTAYSQMSEAQKAALRYNYVLHATAQAQNDYARTAGSWANQMRLLTNNWQTLITAVGQGLTRILAPVVELLNKMLTMLISVVNAIAAVFGGKGFSGGGGGSSSPIGGLADDASNLEDNLDGATDSAKKFKATIAGFDELETLVPQPTDSGAGSGGLGGGGISAADLDSYFDIGDGGETLNKLEEWFQKLKELMDSGDWEQVGREIAEALNNLMYWLDDWLLNTFEPWGVKWAEITARVLNGVVEAFDWEFFGKLVADGFNSIIHICNTFLEEFNSLALGEGIGRAVNSWFDNIDWEGVGHFFANNLNFFIDIAAGFFDQFITQAYENGQKVGDAFNAFVDWIHWDELARAIYEGLNSLALMIQGFVDQVKWDELKEKVNKALSDIFENLDMESIKNAVSSLITNIMDFLTSLPWYEIGHTVGEMLSGVDWLGTFKDFKDNVVWPALKGFWDGLMSDGKNGLIGEIGKIVSWFKESFWGPILEGIIKIISVKLIFDAIVNAFRGEVGWFQSYLATDPSFKNAIVSYFTIDDNIFANSYQAIKTFATNFSGSYGTAMAGGASKTKAFTTAFQAATGLTTGAIATFAAVAAAVASLCSAYDGFGGVINRIKEVFSDAAENVKKFAKAIGMDSTLNRCKESFNKLKEALGKVYDALGKLKPVWELFFTNLEKGLTVIGEVAAALVEVLAVALTVVLDVATKLVDGIGDVFNTLGDIVQFIADWVDKIIGFFKDLKYQLIGDPIVIDMVNGIVDAFKQFIVDAAAVFDGFVDTIVAIFQAIWDGLTEVMEGIRTFLEETWTAIKDFAVEIWENIQTFLSDTWNAINDDTTSVWDAIQTFLQETWDAILTLVETVWENILKLIEDYWNAVQETTTNIWNAIHDFLSQIWDTITTLVETVWNNLWNLIQTYWTYIQDTTTTIWNAIHDFLYSIWETIKTTIDTAINWVKDTIGTVWNAVQSKTEEIWNAIQLFLSGLWDKIKTEADTITGQIRDFWVNAYNKITETWNGFKGWWAGIWDGVADTCRAAMNAVIDILNGFSITVPDWVPEIGGETWSFNLPHLAKGGIISGPTLALLGEYAGAKNNPEIAAPQSLLKEIINQGNDDLIDVWVQTVRQILEAIENVDLSVAIGDDVIGQAANRANNAYKRRTGKPLFSI